MSYNQSDAAAPKKSFAVKSRRPSRFRPKLAKRPAPASSESILQEQVRVQASQPRKKQGRPLSGELPTLPTLEVMEPYELSLSQNLQRLASEADDDPQLAQMYWCNRGCQGDAEALLDLGW